MEENIVQNQEVVNQNNNLDNKENQYSETYLELITERDESNQPLSVLEVDLVISREKGKENRNLSINFTGIDIEKKEMIEKRVTLDKQNFDIIKNFFSQLRWDS
jgi:hypothetical protein